MQLECIYNEDLTFWHIHLQRMGCCSTAERLYRISRVDKDGDRVGEGGPKSHPAFGGPQDVRRGGLLASSKSWRCSRSGEETLEAKSTSCTNLFRWMHSFFVLIRIHHHSIHPDQEKVFFCVTLEISHSSLGFTRAIFKFESKSYSVCDVKKSAYEINYCYSTDSVTSSPDRDADSTAEDDIPAEMYVPNQQMWLELRLRRSYFTPPCC